MEMKCEPSKKRLLVKSSKADEEITSERKDAGYAAGLTRIMCTSPFAKSYMGGMRYDVEIWSGGVGGMR